jgi:multiple sugar transport system permease protein
VQGRGGRLRHGGRPLTYVFLVLAALFSAWPILVMALEGYGADLAPLISGQAVRHIGDVIVLGGFYPSPTHYLDALHYVAFPRLMVNTSAIAAISIAIALAAGVGTGYALVRVPIRGKGVVAYTLLALRAVSPFAVVVPLYVLFTRNGLWDTYLGAALAEEMVTLSVVVWMLRGFFSDIPREIYDAAEVFGASEWQIFRRVALRMVIPGIVVTALFAFVLIWNDFVISVVVTGPVAKTVAVGVWTGLGSGTSSHFSVNWDDLNAAGFLSWLPAIVVVLSIRKYLAKGYSLGTAKASA